MIMTIIKIICIIKITMKITKIVIIKVIIIALNYVLLVVTWCVKILFHC